jgi:transcription initiation factor TFIID subunit TAF12
MNPQHDPNNPMNQPLFSKQKLRELTHMTCPGERFDPNIENIMVKIAEEFVAKVAHGSCDLARHRKSKVLEVEDVQLHLGNPTVFRVLLKNKNRSDLGSWYSRIFYG